MVIFWGNIFLGCLLLHQIYEYIRVMYMFDDDDDDRMFIGYIYLTTTTNDWMGKKVLCVAYVWDWDVFCLNRKDYVE